MFYTHTSRKSFLSKSLAAFSMTTLVMSLVVPVALMPMTASAAIPFSDGFEPNPDHFLNWTSVDGSPGGTWGSSSSGVHSGDFSAQVNGDTGSSDDVLRKAESTAGKNNITLKYWYRADNLDNPSGTASDDRAYIEYSINSGTSWTSLYNVNDVENDDDDGNWHQKIHSISSAADSSGFQFRFRAHLNNGNDKVWFDDVELIGDTIVPATIIATKIVCEDESTIIFDSISRKVWAQKGTKPRRQKNQ